MAKDKDSMDGLLPANCYREVPKPSLVGAQAPAGLRQPLGSGIALRRAVQQSRRLRSWARCRTCCCLWAAT